jgi:O-antigen/teichoic acid export membrane protein
MHLINKLAFKSNSMPMFKSCDSVDIKSLAKGGSISFLGSIGSRTVGLLLQIILSRFLGAAGYGLYSLALAVVGFSQGLSMMGVSNGMLRFASSYYGQGSESAFRRSIYISLRLILITTLITGTVIYLYSDYFAIRMFHDASLGPVLAIMSVSIPFLGVTNWAASLAASVIRMREVVFINNIAHSIFNLFFILLALYMTRSVAGVAWGYMLSTVAVLLTALYIARDIIRQLSYKTVLNSVIDHSPLPPTPSAHSIMRLSLPLFLSGFSYMAILYIDRFMLGYFGKMDSVGIYNASATVAIQLTMVLGACISVFSPLIASAHARGDTGAFHLLYKKATWWSVIITVPIYAVLVFNSRLIMGLFGAEFAIGWTALFILTVGQLYNVATGPVGVILQMTGRHKLDLIANGILVLLNFFLNILLIPRYGIIGAAMATFLSMVAVHTLRLYQVYRIYGIHPYSLSYYPVIAFVAPASILAFYMSYAGWSGPLCVILTFLFILAFIVVLVLFCIDDNDKDIFHFMLKKVTAAI